MLAQNDAVNREQLEEDVVERAPSEAIEKEFYLPHRAVLEENAETTKLRVVYDASTRAHNDAPSLNNCLHAGPPLQNQLWSVLTRNQFNSVAVFLTLKCRSKMAKPDLITRDHRVHLGIDSHTTPIFHTFFIRIRRGDYNASSFEGANTEDMSKFNDAGNASKELSVWN